MQSATAKKPKAKKAKRKQTTPMVNRHHETLPDLTPKQLAFVQGILEGKTATDAYRSAYDVADNLDVTIWANASRLRNDNKVAAWLEAARLASFGGSTVTLQNHLEELARLKEIAIRTNQTAAAVQAETARGKVIGLYEDKLRITSDIDSNQLIAVLTQALGADTAATIAEALGVDMPIEDALLLTSETLSDTDDSETWDK